MGHVRMLATIREYASSDIPLGFPSPGSLLLQLGGSWFNGALCYVINLQSVVCIFIMVVLNFSRCHVSLRKANAYPPGIWNLIWPEPKIFLLNRDCAQRPSTWRTAMKQHRTTRLVLPFHPGRAPPYFNTIYTRPCEV